LRQSAVWRPLRSKYIRDRVVQGAEASDFAISLRDLYPAVRHGLVPVCDEVFPHRRKKRRPPRRLDVREFLAIDPNSCHLLDEFSSPGTEGFSSFHIFLHTMSPLIPRR